MTLLEGLEKAKNAGVKIISFVDTGYGPELKDAPMELVVEFLKEMYELKRLYEEERDTAAVVTAETNLDEKIARSSAPKFWKWTSRGICKNDLAPEMYLRNGIIDALANLAITFIRWDIVGEEEYS